MGDAENSLPVLKKRTAERQITRETLGCDDEEDTSGQEIGTFKKASDEVLASRRIVKVRRQQTSTTSSAPNPFAGIRLVPPTNLSSTPTEVTFAAESRKSVSEERQDDNGASKETEGVKDRKETNLESKVDELGPESAGNKEKDDTVRPQSAVAESDEVNKTKEKADEVDTEAKTDADDSKNVNEEVKVIDGLNVQKDGEATPFSSFQQLSSSQNAFTGVAGSGFSSSTFSFGPISKDGSSVSSYFGLDGRKNGNSPLFSSSGASVANKSEASGVPSMQEVTVETGEENERPVFTADSVLFEFLDGSWKERGKGEIKINISSVGTGKARLVMRARGNYRLILNASLYPDMKLTAMEKKGITFACMNSNSEGKKEGLSTFALKFKDASIVEEFRAVVTEHKGMANAGLKTPENSP